MENINPFAQMLATIVCSVLASSGLWTLISKKLDRNNAESRMLKGLGHSKIVETGMIYVNRSWITKDEYEDLYTYLYIPYKALGGNGSAERIMDEVKRLPMRDPSKMKKE